MGQWNQGKPWPGHKKRDQTTANPWCDVRLAILFDVVEISFVGMAYIS